jgi:hypothetical protein
MADDTQESISVKQTPKGGLTLADKISLDPTQTDSILENMQRFIDERQGPMNQLMRGLKSAYSVTGGPAAIATYDREKALEDKDVMDYRQQMGAFRAAQAQSAGDAARLSKFEGGAGAGTGGTGGADPLSQLSPEARQRYNLARSPSEKLAIINEDLKTRGTERAKKQFDPASLDLKEVVVYNPINKKDELQKVNAFQYQQLLEAGLISNPVDWYTAPSSPRTNPAAAPAAPAAPVATNAPAAPTRPVVTAGADGFIPSAGNATALASALDVPLISGDRDYAKQAELKMASQQPGYKGPPVAAPGTSQHEFGNAIDVDSSKLTAEQRTMLTQAGFVQPYANDPNHWELSGSKIGEKLTAAPADVIKTKAPVSATTPIRDNAALLASSNRPAGGPPDVAAMQRERVNVETEEKAAAEARGKSGESQRAAFEIDIDPNTVAEMDAMSKRMQKIVKENPEIAGVINKNDYVSAVAGVVQKGIGNFGVADLENAIFKTLPETTQKSIGRRSELITYLARIELQAAKIIKGQGQITEGEREILQRASSSISDPAELIYKKARILERANQKNEELAKIYGSGEKFTNFRKFAQDPQFQAIMKKFRADLNGIMDEEISFNKPKVGAKPGKVDHPEDIQEIIKRNKAKKAE